VFAEGEEEQVIRAAAAFVHRGSARRCWSAARTRARGRKALGVEERASKSATPHSSRNAAYAPLYERLQRHGFLQRDCQRLVNQDRNHFAGLHGGARRRRRDGHRRHAQFLAALEDVRRCIDPKPGHRVIGVIAGAGARPSPCSSPTPRAPKCRPARDLADIAIEAASVARRFGYEPRVALLAFSTFGFRRASAASASGGGAAPRSARRRFRI
jgi:malate dehydrogenase (oxaloacetate-decarboxylating)(NADP+)